MSNISLLWVVYNDMIIQTQIFILCVGRIKNANRQCAPRGFRLVLIFAQTRVTIVMGFPDGFEKKKIINKTLIDYYIMLNCVCARTIWETIVIGT